MKNIFTARSIEEVVKRLNTQVEELYVIFGKLGVPQGNVIGNFLVPPGNTITFHNTPGYERYSMGATRGSNVFFLKNSKDDQQLLAFENTTWLRLFNNTNTDTRYIFFQHPTPPNGHYIKYDNFYFNLVHNGTNTGRIHIGWASDAETWIRLFPSNSGTSNYACINAREILQTPTTAVAVTSMRNRIQNVDGAGNSSWFIASAGGATFSLVKYAPSHTTYAGKVALWNDANTDMIFANNNLEKMRLTAGGNLLLGVTSTDGRVDVATDDGSSNYTRMTMYQARVTTTDATPTTLWSHTPTPGRTIMVEARVVARRTAGGGGAAGDGAGYVVRAAYGITAGPTTTLFGTVDQWAREAVAGYDATFVIDGSNNIVLQVTGVAGTNISWQANIYRDIIGG